MSESEIKTIICELAKTSGFYSRLLRDIENSDESEAIWKSLEYCNFKDAMEMIMYLEQ